jgi:acyl CoA:acetate/3-ketoacid CoA transferase beta subunit
MKLIERAEGVSLDEIREKTEASFTVGEKAKAA